MRGLFWPLATPLPSLTATFLDDLYSSWTSSALADFEERYRIFCCKPGGRRDRLGESKAKAKPERKKKKVTGEGGRRGYRAPLAVTEKS